MCAADEHCGEVVTASSSRYASHEYLDSVRARMGSVLKGKGGKLKPSKDQSTQADMKPPLASRMLLPSMVALMCCLVLNQFGLFVPLVLMGRNCVLSKTPREARPKYPMCSDAMLSSEMTIVVTVKDACSQAPGFIRGLEKFAPPGVHLIYTYPDFESCRSIDLKEILARWDKVTVLPLPLRSSPMQGWVDAVPHIKTKYSMLLHNDGAPPPPGARWCRPSVPPARRPGGTMLAAPSCCMSKRDGSFAARCDEGHPGPRRQQLRQGTTVSTTTRSAARSTAAPT